MSTLLVENIRHEDATNPALVLDANGNLGVNLTSGSIGIGESAPEEKLHIKTTSKYALEIQRNSFSDNAENLIRFSNSGTAEVYSGYIGSIRTSGGSGIGDIVFGTAPSVDPGTDSIEERLRITHNGRFGVRTPSPNTTLHVKSNGTGNSYGSLYLEIDEATNYPAMVIQTATGGNYTETHGLYIKNTAAGYGLRIDDTASDTTPFVVDSDGRVGVGTHTPLNKLQIGNTGHSGYALTTQAEQYGVVHQVGETTTPTTAAAFWIRNMNAGGTPTPLLRVNGNGNIGVNTDTPNASIDVHYTSGGYVGHFRNPANGNGFSRIVNATNNNDADIQLQVSQTGATTKYGRLASSVGGLNIVIGDGSGNVGVGTNAPVSELDVNGHVASEQMWTHVYTNMAATNVIPLYEKDGTTLLNSFSGLIMVKDSHRDPAGMLVHVVSGPDLAYTGGIFQTYNELSYKNADGDSQRKYQMIMNGTRAEIQIVGGTSHGSWNTSTTHTIAVTYIGAGL